MDEVKEVPQPRKSTPPKEKPEEAGVTMETMLRFFAEMNERNQESLIAAIKEIKKPSAAEQAKLDKEAAQLEAKVRARIQHAKAHEEMKNNLMRTCTHTSYNPATGVSKHLWVGHVHTPKGEKPFSLPTCQRCGTQLPRIYCTPEQIAGGMQLHEYPVLNLEVLVKWAIQTGNMDAKTFIDDHKLAAAV